MANPFDQFDQSSATPKPIKQGNINLSNRPVVKNADGSISTVRTISVGFDDGEYLIPTVSEDGRIMSDDEAVQTFQQTGRHFGSFKTPEEATAFADQLHNQQEAMYAANPFDRFDDSGMAAELPPVYSQTGEVIQANVPQPKRELSLAEQAVGAGETALAAITGATSGALGYVGGAARGLGNQLLGDATAEQAQQSAEQGAEMLTYAPRTEAGQRMTKAVGDAASVLPPVIAGITPMQAQGAANAARSTAAAARGVEMPSMAAAQVADRSIGAAEIPLEQVRRQSAEALPVPIQLTKGQATQDFAQQRFERETAKSPDDGAALRQRYTEQNQAISQNIDAMLDATETKIGETAYKLETGNKVIKALESGLEAEKKKVSNAYNVARARGETQEIIDPTPLGDYLKENVVDVTVAPVVGLVAREADRMGVASGKLDDGTFQIKPMTVEQSETLRQRVNDLVDATNGQDLRRAAQIKQLIDQAQEPVAGQAFQSARKMRRQLANKYENLAIIDQLLDTKGQYNDQRIAAENVVNRAVIGGTIEDVRNLRRVLTTAGEDGVEAWKEVRAATLRHLRDEVTKNVGRDPLGNPLISASQFDRTIKALDKNGKLDLVFGKQYASQLRDLNEIVKDIYVSQPNAVNTSNTASVLLASIDMMASAGSGIPAPILSSLKLISDKAKKRKTEKRVREALGDKKP